MTKFPAFVLFRMEQDSGLGSGCLSRLSAFAAITAMWRGWKVKRPAAEPHQHSSNFDHPFGSGDGSPGAAALIARVGRRPGSMAAPWMDLDEQDAKVGLHADSEAMVRCAPAVMD